MTAAHKANIMKFSDGLFLDVARKVAERHPDIEFEDRIIDNLCNQLVSRPEEYDVIVLPNLYGDIVSDLGAGMIGGLGLAPGANIGTHAAMFEATHGSAPKYKGQNKVNPTALMLSGVLMLRHLDETEAADRLESAIAAVIAKGERVTYDLKPSRDDPTAVGTSEFADAVIEEMERLMANPVKVAVTGAAGQIGYALLFRIASGQMLGPDTPVHLKLLEIPHAVKAAEGTAMELDDCAFPLLAGIDIHDDPGNAFDGCNVALLVGARPRAKGMERADLLEANGGIFKPQGEAINAHAADDVKVLVVGNPANTNCLIAKSHAPDVPRERFTAMTRLDQNRAMAQLAEKLGVAVTRDHEHDRLGQPLAHAVPRPLPRQGGRAKRLGRGGRRAWFADEYIPGWPSAARRSSRRAGRSARPRRPTRRSTTCATGCSAARRRLGSMAVPSDGSYGVEEGLISGFPCACSGGESKIVEGLEVGDFSRARIDTTVNELKEERDAVKQLGLL